MRKLKICHVQLLPLLSGVQNMMINLLENLDRNKFEITVVSAPDGPMIDKLKEMGIRHIAIPQLIQKINFHDIPIFIEFYNVFRKYKFDIVHTHSSKTGFLGRIAARLAGVKITMHTIHGFPFHPYQSKIVQLFYRNLERVAGFFCDITISVNEFERKLAIQHRIISKRKIRTIYNGIKSLESANPLKRKDFGIDEDQIIIGSVSRFSKQKNIINLIKVAISIVQKVSNIIFIFIGHGENFTYVQQLIENAGVKKNIKLMGWKSNVSDWCSLFDIVVLYSKWEGLSLTILEAMSMKKPIIASNIKGNNELVFHGKNGYLVEIDDHEDLTKKIISLSKDSLKQKKFGEESYKLFFDQYTLEKFCNSYVTLYKELMNKKL